MTEREYVDATNLAKIRMVKAILRDVLPMSRPEQGLLAEALIPLGSLEELLFNAVKTEG